MDRAPGRARRLRRRVRRAGAHPPHARPALPRAGAAERGPRRQRGAETGHRGVVPGQEGAGRRLGRGHVRECVCGLSDAEAGDEDARGGWKARVAVHGKWDGGSRAEGVGGAVGERVGRGEGVCSGARVFVAVDAWGEGDWEEERVEGGGGGGQDCEDKQLERVCGGW